MRWFRILLVSIATVLSACDEWGCDGHTCPFAEPSHHAVVNGVVLDSSDHPLAGIHTSVVFAGQVYSGVGTQTDQTGRFTATARADIRPGSADTVSAWVRATQANPPPAAVIKDSVRVLLHFRPRTEPPIAVETTIHLAVAPTQPGRGEYLILFVKIRSSEPLAQLAIVDPEGGPVTVVVPDSAVYDGLRSSPDGRQVLFTRDPLGPAPHGVHVLDVSGAAVRPLPNVGPGYEWSPDGGKIASLNLIPQPGGPPTKQLRITDTVGVVLVDFPQRNSDYLWPSWSPDAAQLVYTEDVRFDGVPPEVYVASADGTVITNVSNSADYEGEVAWSPAQSQVALFAVRGDDFGIFTMRPDGSDLTLRYRGAEVVGYRWSPDGGRLLFTGPGPEPERQLIVMQADGSAPVVVAQGKLEGSSSTWSPDGQWIAYAVLGPAGEYDVYVVRPDGSGHRNLTQAWGHGRSPVWVRR